MYSLLVRLYARKDGLMDFEGFVSAVTSVIIVEKLNGPSVTRMLGHPLFSEVGCNGCHVAEYHQDAGRYSLFSEVGCFDAESHQDAGTSSDLKGRSKC